MTFDQLKKSYIEKAKRTNILTRHIPKEDLAGFLDRVMEEGCLQLLAGNTFIPDGRMIGHMEVRGNVVRGKEISYGIHCETKNAPGILVKDNRVFLARIRQMVEKDFQYLIQ